MRFQFLILLLFSLNFQSAFADRLLGTNAENPKRNGFNVDLLNDMTFEAIWRGLWLDPLYSDPDHMIGLAKDDNVLELGSTIGWDKKDRQYYLKKTAESPFAVTAYCQTRVVPQFIKYTKDANGLHPDHIARVYGVVGQVLEKTKNYVNWIQYDQSPQNLEDYFSQSVANGGLYGGSEGKPHDYNDWALFKRRYEAVKKRNGRGSAMKLMEAYGNCIGQLETIVDQALLNHSTADSLDLSTEAAD